MYWGQLVHDAGTVSVDCPTTVWWPVPVLHLIYPSRLEEWVSQIEGNWSGESMSTLPMVTSQSLGQETSLVCGADQCSGRVAKQSERWLLPGSVCKRVACWRSWRELGLILKSLYRSRSCGTGLGASNKMGSPQCLHRQTSKSCWPAGCDATVYSFSQYGIENPLNNIMYCADLLYNVCSVSQEVTLPLFRISPSHIHYLFVSQVINTELISSVNFAVVRF